MAEQKTNAMRILEQKKIKKLAVIGQNAKVLHANGGGSSEIKALYEINPLMGMKMLLGGNTKVCYAPGYMIPTKEQESEVNWQQDSVNLETMAAVQVPVELRDFTDTEGDFFEVLQAFIDRERVACNKAQPISEKILDLINKMEEE